MASGSEERVVPDDDTPVEVSETVDMKGDGKKRKFKPFEVMRKLFKSGRKRSKSKDDQQGTIVTQKAKSTPALQTADEDDDDDGGFKTRAARPLGGARSISEDSVFSPDQRDPSLAALNKVAVSEENLARPAFHDELFSKLKKRQTQYSDDDEHGQGDAVVGGQLKNQASSSRESDKSLISMDSSENEEEDMFISGWKSSTPQKPKRSSKSDPHQPMDFESVKSTEHLTSDAAKHKLSVRPNKRKASRQSRKRRDVKSPSGLPSLNEESPSKTIDQSTVSITSADVSQFDMSTSYSEVLQVPTEMSDRASTSVYRTESYKQPHEETLLSSSLKTSCEAKKEQTSVGSSLTAAAKVEEKTLPKPLHPISGRAKDGADNQGVVASAEKENELSQAFNKVKRKSVKMSKEDEIPSNEVTGASKGQIYASASSDAGGKYGEKVEVKFSSKTESSLSQTSHFDSKDAIATSSSVEQKQAVVRKMSSESVKEDDKSETSSVKSNSSLKREGLKTTDTSDIVSPGREDYRLRRQTRSKTLPEQPVAKDEQYATKIQRTNSHRVDFGSGSPNSSPQKRDVMTSSVIMSSEVSGRKSDPKRWTWTEAEQVITEPVNREPEWMAALRKRKAGANEDESNSSGKTQQSNVGAKTQQTSVDAKTPQSNIGVKAQQSNVGVKTQQSNVGVKAQQSNIGVKPQQSNIGVKPQQSNVGTKMQQSEPKPKEVFVMDVSKEKKNVDSLGQNVSSSMTKPTTTTPAERPPVSKSGNLPSRGSSVKVESALRPDSVKSFTSRASSVKVQTSKTDSLSSRTSPGEESSKPFTKVDMSKSSSSITSESVKPSYSLSDSKKSFTRVSSSKASSGIASETSSVEAKKTFSRVDSTKTSSAAQGTSMSKVSTAETNKKAESKPVMSFNSRGSVQSKDIKPTAPSPWKTSVPPKKENVSNQIQEGLAPVKIEIIEKDQHRVEAPVKKKIPPLTTETPEKCSSNRSSKVLDMVKNFQKMQTTEPVFQ